MKPTALTTEGGHEEDANSCLELRFRDLSEKIQAG
jgi:hypothetical protein